MEDDLMDTVATTITTFIGSLPKETQELSQRKTMGR